MDLKEMRTGPAPRHPWELSRERFFARVLRDEPAAKGRILDVGAGDAFFARSLASRMSGAAVTCWDANYDASHLGRLEAAAPALRFVRERPEERFDLLLLLDVLEHVEDDRGFLGRLVAENLADGGTALVSVPAWPALFGPHDVRLGHHRRYRPEEAVALVQGAGLTIDVSGGLFASLLAPRWAGVLVQKARGVREADESAWNGGPLLTKAVQSALDADAAASLFLARRRLRVPGLSWWCLCRKSSTSSPASTKSAASS